MIMEIGACGVGEHHTVSMPASSPGALLATEVKPRVAEMLGA